jgi:hypothetical protein
MSIRNCLNMAGVGVVLAGTLVAAPVITAAAATAQPVAATTASDAVAAHATAFRAADYDDWHWRCTHRWHPYRPWLCDRGPYGPPPPPPTGSF